MFPMLATRFCGVITAGLFLLAVAPSPSEAASCEQQAVTAPSPEPPGWFHFRICNCRSAAVSAAVKYNSDGTNFATHGWWQIEANTCQDIADFRQGDFYMFAQSIVSGTLQVFTAGSDTAKFCVSSPANFTYFGTKTCAARDQRDFTHIKLSKPATTWLLKPD
jgi:uncharacterized membrane protein